VLNNVVEVQHRSNEEFDALIKLLGGLIDGRGNGQSGS
jgi:hypothetical protein